MSASKTIKIAMINKGVSVGDLADRLAIRSTTLSTQLWRDAMGYDRVVEILDALDCDLVIRDKATGKIYDIGSVAPAGEIGEADSGAVTPKNNSKKQKPTN